MSTPPKQPFGLKAAFLGPVFSLNGVFSKKDQNIIFARNGTGKSFLSRGFRYLDMFGQSLDVTDAAKNLVSDESPDGKGSFIFLSGAEVLGEISLDKGNENPIISAPDTIFHVFSEDFVEKELRERTYRISGEIENQIAVDSQNIELEDAKVRSGKAISDLEAARTSLKTKFESEKITELATKAAVSKRLKDYSELTLESLLESITEIPDIPDKNFSEALDELDKLKSIPGDPIHPKKMPSFKSDNTDIESVRKALSKVTSPSSVSETVKNKIDSHREFFETGIRLTEHTEAETCPFCEQGTNKAGPREVIDTYIEYFNAEEEKHKTDLRKHYRKLGFLEKEIDAAELFSHSQSGDFDKLKSFIPSQKDKVLQDTKPVLDAARDAIAAIKQAIEAKAANLSVASDMPPQTLLAELRSFNEIIEANNALVEILSVAVNKSDDERKTLQRDICEVFKIEFAIANWTQLKTVRDLIDDAKKRGDELLILEKSSPATDAKTRVAETFDLLLKQFFPGKYVFDKETFILKRGEHTMTRGADRTLSDGEKTAIAFCYFVACIHRKVTANSDYRRIFLVFDDPVTSMSYDFIFTIAQTLKNLNISSTGNISINPDLINGSSCRRPRLIILTHSSYFFNISTSNRVVEASSAFSLHCDKNVHTLTKMTKYVAPFQQQLKEIHNIANGQAPDHRTANSIRSVLEAVGRFCRPDKSDSLTNFIQFLAGSDGIEIKSVLINTLSHGTYLEEIPPPDDLVLACAETLEVVKRYAVGQLEVIEAANKASS